MGTPAVPPGAQCDGCQHYRGLTEIAAGPDLESDWAPACAAYPQGIPEALLRDEADHRRPYPGDGGIRYAAMADASAWLAGAEDPAGQ